MLIIKNRNGLKKLNILFIDSNSSIFGSQQLFDVKEMFPRSEIIMAQYFLPGHGELAKIGGANPFQKSDWGRSSFEGYMMQNLLPNVWDKICDGIQNFKNWFSFVSYLLTTGLLISF